MELINKAHEIMKDLELEDKKKILKYISIYRNIINNNLQNKENSLYQKYGLLDNNDKILFEVSRIERKLNEYSNELQYIYENIYILSKMQSGYLKTEKERQIINDIIDLEINLDIPVTLYNEFIEYFKTYLYEESYQKKRD